MVTRQTSLAEQWLAVCRPRLPLQNPLWAFVHNNILMHFEERPFLEAVREAAALYRARPFESEAFYRDELERGRIRRECLQAVLAARRATLGEVDVERFLAESSIGDALAPLEHLRLAPRLPRELAQRHQRRLEDLLVPLVAAYLDQGLAGWSTPLADGSLWDAFRESVATAPGWSFDWREQLVRRLASHDNAGRDLEALIEAEVRECALDADGAAYCLETLFVLKGWSGLVWRLESEPELAPVQAPAQLRLRDWLAVLLVTQHALDDALLEELGVARVRAMRQPAPIEATRSLARLALWQEAYERSFAGPFLEHLERGPRKPDASTPPRFQALVCMDDREESFRRALEAQSGGCETFGAVGFFGVDMRFERVGAALATCQCPPIIKPSRTLRETPLDGQGAALARLEQAGRAGATASLAAYYHSRSLLRGVAVSLGLGLASFVPLVFKTLLPGRIERWRSFVLRAAFPRPRTRIALEAQDGYSIEEQAGIVEAVLRTCGLTREFAPLVAVIAHGSTSSNNPFRQAYGCGACSGNSGAPNARAFAAMANSSEVRARLASRGFELPAQVLFVPCLHDTALDRIEMLDRHAWPTARKAELEQLEASLESAARANACERGVRFEQGPVYGLTRVSEADAAAIAQHVQDRGHDLAQPRPEYGHNRVAACIIGRRAITRGLFLDRRSFLVSYDPTQDPRGERLPAAVLGSAPVAVNIAMDYYFSRVDPEGFGAGSKLPLNVVSLLGVITGSKSDLRIGLARQMVELHEPLRILVLLEARAEHVTRLVDGHARLSRLVRGGWMQLGRIDPDTQAIELWNGEQFEPWRSALPEFAEPADAPSALDTILASADDRLAPALP